MVKAVVETVNRMRPTQTQRDRVKLHASLCISLLFIGESLKKKYVYTDKPHLHFVPGSGQYTLYVLLLRIFGDQPTSANRT